MTDLVGFSQVAKLACRTDRRKRITVCWSASNSWVILCHTSYKYKTNHSALGVKENSSEKAGGFMEGGGEGDNRESRQTPQAGLISLINLRSSTLQSHVSGKILISSKGFLELVQHNSVPNC